LIVRLGSHVLLRAAHEAARWQRELPREERPLFVSVNISSRQIFRQNLIQEIRHILGRNIVPKGSLRLEITESLVMENPEQATEILEWLRGAGAELALDDFGTGYSSLAYLQRFPFDTIKIDRALVQASGESGGAGSAIVRSIVALGHELGKSVVAEGVETPEDVAFLRSINCGYAQGFYYGEPMSDRDVLQLLKMVRTAEHKLRPRGLFRAKTKGKDKERRKKVAANGVAAEANGTNGAAPPQANSRPPAALPNSTLRPRPRPAGPPHLDASQLPPPPLPPIHHDGGVPVHFNGPPQLPSEFGAPDFSLPHGEAHASMPPPIHDAGPPVFDVPHLSNGNGFDPGMPSHEFAAAPPPPPPQMAEHFSPPPPPEHYAEPPAQPGFAGPPMPPMPMNGAPSPFDLFTEPPQQHAMDGAPDSHAQPEDINPLFAAMAQELQLPIPPQHPVQQAPSMPAQAPRPHHAAGNGAANGAAKPVARKQVPDFSGLPPQMAASLAKLAGVPWPPNGDGDDERELADHEAGQASGVPHREG
jgi:EAL domain-containing protein (putative c-di-GMP-specific phosphodiesterase class I)